MTDQKRQRKRKSSEDSHYEQKKSKIDRDHPSEIRRYQLTMELSLITLYSFIQTFKGVRVEKKTTMATAPRRLVDGVRGVEEDKMVTKDTTATVASIPDLMMLVRNCFFTYNFCQSIEF